MFKWHESDCRRPDVVFVDGIDAPSCLNCGNVAASANEEKAPFGVTISKPTSQADFELRWPSSLPWADEYPSQDIVKEAHFGVETKDGKAGGEETPSTVPSLPLTQTIGSQPNTQSPSFYEPLSARRIRVIRLLPGSYRDAIRCELQSVDLALKPDYEALSYTWADLDGNTSRCQKIYIGKQWDILAVTTSCANALRRLRFPNSSRKLWVDAVCIDQSNTDERSHQVGLMQFIYATASRVLIYLGEDPADPDPESTTPWMYMNTGNTLAYNEHLIQRPYFSRVWVIQEIASARSAWVLCGSRGVRWEDVVEQHITHISLPHMRKSERAKQIPPWLQFVARPRFRELSEFYGFLSATTQCLASDPRDKIFALLGLFQGTQSAGLVADYSLNQHQLCAGTTAFFLLHHPENRVRILSLARTCSSSRLPSWAVDWLAPSEPLPILQKKLSRKPVEIRRTLLEHELYGRGSLDTEESAPIRFHRSGALVIEAFYVFSLRNCVYHDLGFAGLQYIPSGSLVTDDFPLNLPEWTRVNDRVFLSPAISGHALVLRQVMGRDDHSFVGIFPLYFSVNGLPKETQAWERAINSFSQERLFVFSAWNRFMRTKSTKAWTTQIFWGALKDSCRAIRRSWSLEVRLWTKKFVREALGAQRKGRAPGLHAPDHKTPMLEHRPSIDSWLCLRQELSHIRLAAAANATGLEDTDGIKWSGQNAWAFFENPDDSASEEKIASHVYSSLVQACWDWGKYGDFDSRDKSRHTKPPGWDGYRALPWHDGYFENISTELIFQVLETTFGVDMKSIFISYSEDRTLQDPKKLAFCMISQDLGFRHMAISRLEQMASEFQVLKAQEAHPNPNDDRNSYAVIRWLRGSLGFEGNTQPACSDGAPSLQDCWAALHSPFTGEGGELHTELMEKSLTQQFRLRKSKWAPLLELVRQTEALLFPMEKAFTAESEEEQHFHLLGFLKDPPEEIRII